MTNGEYSKEYIDECIRVFLLTGLAIIEQQCGLFCDAKRHIQNAESRIRMLNEKMERNKKLNAV